MLAQNVLKKKWPELVLGFGIVKIVIQNLLGGLISLKNKNGRLQMFWLWKGSEGR